MLADRSTDSFLLQPNPGEIWEIGSAADVSGYLMIVHEPVAPNLQICSGMLLSLETEQISNVDLLLPKAISGLPQDVLAETWNVGELSIDHLICRVGKRLSRKVYDLLLWISNVDSEVLVSQRAAGLCGLVMASSFDAEKIAQFHSREQRRLQSMSLAALVWTADLLAQAIETERELTDLMRPRVILSVWLAQVFEPLASSLAAGWQDAANFVPRMAISTRSLVSTDEVARTIAQLEVVTDEHQRRELIQKLGLMASQHQEALLTLTKLVATTQDDETLWVAVDSLRQVEPNHPSLGIRRLKSIELHYGDNLPIKVVFVVNVLQKVDRCMGILLQLYPEPSHSFLPANLKLLLQDPVGDHLRKVVTAAGDRYIQLKFNGDIGEAFRVCLELGNAQITEDFMI